MTAFHAKQRQILEALAAPAVPGESVKSVFARIAQRAQITRSKAEKAWRGYAILRADEWERAVRQVNENAAIERRSGADNVDREFVRRVEERLDDLAATIRRLDQRMAGAPPDPRGRRP